MAWLTPSSNSTGSAIPASMFDNISHDIRIWGGNVDAATYALANLSQITGASNVLSILATRVICKANSEQYGIGLYYNAASAVPIFLGATSAGAFAVADAGGSTHMTVTQAGLVGIGTVTPTSPLQVTGIPTYASDSAAGTAGLTTGAFFKDSTGGLHIKL